MYLSYKTVTKAALNVEIKSSPNKRKKIASDELYYIGTILRAKFSVVEMDAGITN